MSKGRLNYGLLSKYRAVLMGVAIIFIMFCHLDVAQTHNDVSTTGLARAMHLFTVGVDIFLFLSGMGLYYSYRKNSQSYLDYEKKRMVRILPSYFIIGGGTYLIYDLLMQKLSFGKFLQDVFFLTWLKGESSRYWYIFAIIVFYLLFPLLYKFIHRGKHALLKTIMLSVSWWLVIEVLCQFIGGLRFFRIALERLPFFAIGIYAGKLAYEKREISYGSTTHYILTGYAAFIALKLPGIKGIADHLYYPVRGLLAISIMTTVIVVMELLEHTIPRVNSRFCTLLGWFGGLSLELYLLHQSYMILMEFPYKLPLYIIAAFALPTITALVIYIVRQKRRKA